MTDITTPKPPHTQGPHTRGIASTLMYLAIIALLMAGWAWQYWQQQKQQAQNAATQTQIDRLNHQLNQSAQHRALITANSTLQLAEFQRQYHHDAKATTALLQQALQQVNFTQYPALQSLHQALQHDITTMQAHTTEDPSTWLTQIDALKHTITQLQQIPTKMAPTKQPEPAATPTPVPHTWWQCIWRRSKKILASMVVIHRSQHAVTPLLTPNDLTTLKNNLALTLSQAQWAIMHHEAKLYQQSITSARHILSHFAANNPHTMTFDEALDQLQHAPLDAELPPLKQSFEAIDRLLNIEAHRPPTVAPEANELTLTEDAPNLKPLL